MVYFPKSSQRDYSAWNSSAQNLTMTLLLPYHRHRIYPKTTDDLYGLVHLVFSISLILLETLPCTAVLKHTLKDFPMWEGLPTYRSIA